MWSYLFVKNTTKVKISASQRISIKNCIYYDHNKEFGLFKNNSGYRKLYLNSPKGYSRKIIIAQTDQLPFKVLTIFSNSIYFMYVAEKAVMRI